MFNLTKKPMNMTEIIKMIYIFGQIQWLMFVVVNFSALFNAFGHIHSVILIRSNDYSSSKRDINRIRKNNGQKELFIFSTMFVLHDLII